MLKIIRWAATLAIATMLASHLGFTTPQALSANVSKLLGTAQADATPESVAPNGANPVLFGENTGRNAVVRTCEFTLNVPPGTDPTYVDLITEAADKYNRSTKFRVNVAVGSGDVPVQFVAGGDGTTGATALSDQVKSTGVIIPKQLTVYTDVHATLSRTEQLHTYVHEIGHFLGLGHSDIPNTLMYPYTNHATELTKYELKTLAKHAKGC